MYNANQNDMPKNAESHAFISLYDAYVDLIYRFILLRVSHQETAWDLTQECFLRMWQYTQRSDAHIKTPKTFLYTIAKNIVIDYWRQKEKRKTITIDDISLTLADTSNNTHEKAVLCDETRGILNMLNTLAPHQKEIIILRFVEDLSFFDIARMTGKSVISVRVEAHRAIKKLKQLHEKRI